VTIHKNRLFNTTLINGHSIGFGEEIKKVVPLCMLYLSSVLHTVPPCRIRVNITELCYAHLYSHKQLIMIALFQELTVKI